MPNGSKTLLCLSACALCAGVSLWGCDSSDSGGDGGSGGAQANGGDGSGGDGGGGVDGSGGDTSTDDDGGTPNMQAVHITFGAAVGEEAFACDATFSGMGTGDASIHMTDLRMYVHDVRLVAAGGAEQALVLDDNAFQHAGVGLLDFEDMSGSCSGTAETHRSLDGTVPEGDYVGLKFKLGVPEDMNHMDPTTSPAPLDVSGMMWSWTLGHKFLRADALTGAGFGVPFFVQVGSSMCTGDPAAGENVSCARANRPEISLDGFDAATQKVVLDYAALVASADLESDGGGAPGCMSDATDPECPGVFAAVGLDFDSGESQAGQTVFRVMDQ